MKFYTTSEVSDILKIDIQTVRRFIREGYLFAHKFGREYRVSKDDLEQYIEKHKKEVVE